MLGFAGGIGVLAQALSRHTVNTSKKVRMMITR
jgi:hypothetical protein